MQNSSNNTSEIPTTLANMISTCVISFNYLFSRNKYLIKAV